MDFPVLTSSRNLVLEDCTVQILNDKTLAPFNLSTKGCAGARARVPPLVAVTKFTG